MRKIKLIPQDDAYGCGPAVIATILGKKYDDVAKDWQNDFTSSGISTEQIANYLGDHKCSIVHKAVRNWHDKDFAKDEMLKPFAPVHIVVITPQFDSRNNHVVVMDAKGAMYCPGLTPEEDIRDSYAVVEVLGIWR